MSTSKLCSLLVALVGLFSLGTSGTAFALGGAGNAGAPAVGTAGGGAHGGGGGAAHVGGAPVGARSFAGSTNSFHGSLGAASFRTGAAAYNGAPHYLPGGFTPNVSGVLGSRGRPASLNTASRPVTASQAGVAVAHSTAFSRARVNNAWTDPSAPAQYRTNRAVLADLHNQSDAAYRNYIGNGNYNGLTTPDGFTGTVLYPGAYGSALGNYFNRLGPNGSLVDQRGAYSYAQPQNWYGPNAGNHPYWPNGYRANFGPYGYPFFGSYFGFGDGEFGGYGDAGLNTGVVPSAPDQSVATVEDNQNTPTAEQPPQAPATPERAAASRSPNGPDSLVEAVQEELALRGYFAGKVDAIYGEETKAALRRFQTDQKLNVTGRVNEATLHALQLD